MNFINHVKNTANAHGTPKHKDKDKDKGVELSEINSKQTNSAQNFLHHSPSISHQGGPVHDIHEVFTSLPPVFITGNSNKGPNAQNATSSDRKTETENENDGYCVVSTEDTHKLDFHELKWNSYYTGYAKFGDIPHGDGKYYEGIDTPSSRWIQLIYEGPFQNGKYHGENGTLYDEKGNIKYQGAFKDNKPHGKGTYFVSNNVIDTVLPRDFTKEERCKIVIQRQGIFGNETRIEEKGAFSICNNGIKYEGNFDKSGKMSGPGTFSETSPSSTTPRHIYTLNQGETVKYSFFCDDPVFTPWINQIKAIFIIQNSENKIVAEISTTITKKSNSRIPTCKSLLKQHS
jgi:hypothetical protein